MALIRMGIKTSIVGGGPVASLIVLQPHGAAYGSSTQLPIRIGPIEATAISMGIGSDRSERPMTHDLLAATIKALDAKLVSVSIVDVRGTTFYATLKLATSTGSIVEVDARPSDAIALAVRTGAPVFAEEHVLDTAAMPDFDAIDEAEKTKSIEEFHSFVENLSPEDFD